VIEYQVRLFSQPLPNNPGHGAFTPTTFTEWIGHEVVVTGLAGWPFRHMLAGVENSADGMESRLTIHTTKDPGADLTADLSIRVGTPKAQIRAYLVDDPDTLVTTAMLDAPLTMQQTVTVNGLKCTVQEITYPYRDPDHPENTEDYQRVVLRAEPDPPDVAPAMPPMAGPLLGFM
jgi:hypothetical protein